MKINYLFILFILLLAYGCLHADSNKTWQMEEHQPNAYFTMHFSQDNETGTRCYSVIPTTADGGAAISCVPKGVK